MENFFNIFHSLSHPQKYWNPQSFMSFFSKKWLIHVWFFVCQKMNFLFLNGKFQRGGFLHVSLFRANWHAQNWEKLQLIFQIRAFNLSLLDWSVIFGTTKKKENGQIFCKYWVENLGLILQLLNKCKCKKIYETPLLQLICLSFCGLKRSFLKKQCFVNNNIQVTP